MERKHKVDQEKSLKFREKFCPEIRVSDDKISAEELDLLEKKKAMEELLKERRNTEVEEWKRHSCCWR